VSKPRVIKYFDKLDDETKAELLQIYPFGFEKKLVTIRNHKGELITALPYENSQFVYLIKMSKAEAEDIYKDLEEMDFEDLDTDDNDPDIDSFEESDQLESMDED
jgi:hypothetical protein